MPFLTSALILTNLGQITDNLITSAKITGNVAVVESFSINTDSNGQATVTLAHTPAANKFYAGCVTANRQVAAYSLSGADLTVTVRKSAYDKASSTATDAGNLPSGVTAQSALFSVSGTTGTIQGATAGAAPGGDNVFNHTHTFSTNVTGQYTHSHAVTSFIETSFPLAASESGILVVVVYGKA